MHTVHVLTVSSRLPMELQDALLSGTETVLHEHGASRIWVDPSLPGTNVVAEFLEPAATSRRRPVEELTAEP